MRFSYSKGRLDALVETQPPNPEEAMRCWRTLVFLMCIPLGRWAAVA